MKILLYTILLLISGSFVAFSQTQNYSISHYTTKDGLPNNEVNDIIQDKNGFIWIGTHNGLCRYDGYEFINYFNDQGDSTSLSNNVVTKLTEDTLGYIWVSTWHGLNRLDPRTRKIKRFYQLFPHGFGKGSSSTIVTKDRKGNIFCCGQTAIMKWNYNSEKFESFYPEIFNSYKDSISDILGIYLDSYNQYWITFRTEIRFLDEKNKKLNKVSSELDLTTFMFAAEGSDHNFYLGTWTKGMVCLNPKTKKAKFILRGNPAINPGTIFQSGVFAGSDTLWLTNGTFGIALFDIKSERLEVLNFQNIPLNEKYSPPIRKIFADKQNNIWCGSEYGIYKVINRPPVSISYNFDSLKAAGKIAFRIKQEYQNPDNLLIRTADDLRLSRFNLSDQKFEWISEITIRNKKLKLGEVYSYNYDQFNRLWIFTGDNDIICYDKVADTIFKSHYDLGRDPVGIPYRFQFAFIDKNKKTWLCAWGGLYYIENGLVKKFEFKNEKARYGIDFSNVIYKITGDNFGYIWLTRNYSWEGRKTCITRIRLSDESFENYFDDGKKGSISGDQDFFSFTIDRHDILWISGVNGLSKCYTGNIKTEFIPVRQHSPFNYGFTRNLLLFGDTMVVQSTGGLILLDVTSEKVLRKYDEKDGLFPFSDLISIHALDNSRVMLNFGERYQIINMAISEPASQNFKPVITSIRIKEADFTEYRGNYGFAPYIDKVTMKPGVQDVEFKFSPNDFSEKSSNLFTYYLEGFENKWLSPVYSNTIRYNNLEPGHYVFHLRMVNRNNQWGEAVSVPVIVKPYFYQTLPFKFAVFLVIILSAFAFIRYRFKTRLEKQIALQNERERISSDLHDDLGSGLTSIAMISEMMKNQTGNTKEDGKLNEISGIAQELVDNMREIVWALNSKNDSLENLIGYVHEHAQRTFEFSDINLIVDIPERIAEIQLAAESRRNIFLTVKETLNNSIRYSGAQNIFMSFIINDSRLRIEIKDDGTGFDSYKVRKNANGIKNMNKRMEKIGGKYSIQSGPGKGTVTEILLHLNS